MGSDCGAASRALCFKLKSLCLVAQGSLAQGGPLRRSAPPVWHTALQENSLETSYTPSPVIKSYHQLQKQLTKKVSDTLEKCIYWK